MKRIIVEVKEEQHHAFKMAVLQDNKTISEVLKAFIDKYIKRQKLSDK